MTVEQEWIRPEGREELVPGDVGPRRAVPARIERPEYVDKDEAVSDSGEGAGAGGDRAGARGVADRDPGLRAPAAARPGVTTDHIDAVVHDVLVENSAYPSPLGYLHFPNPAHQSEQVVCHGIPTRR